MGETQRLLATALFIVRARGLVGIVGASIVTTEDRTHDDEGRKNPKKKLF
jgi:hypothetical protein